jgi:hypothetical protein
MGNPKPETNHKVKMRMFQTFQFPILNLFRISGLAFRICGGPATAPHPTILPPFLQDRFAAQSAVKNISACRIFLILPDLQLCPYPNGAICYT